MILPVIAIVAAVFLVKIPTVGEQLYVSVLDTEVEFSVSSSTIKRALLEDLSIEEKIARHILGAVSNIEEKNSQTENILISQKMIMENLDPALPAQSRQSIETILQNMFLQSFEGY